MKFNIIELVSTPIINFSNFKSILKKKKMKHINTSKLLLFLIIVFAMTSCTAGGDRFIEESGGFWMGLWHGFILLFTFVGSLFIDGLEVYEKNNNGNWYNFGFLLGVMFFFGGGGKGSCRRRR